MSSERFVASNFDRDYLKVVLLGGLDCGVLGRMSVPDEIRPRPPLFPATLSERRSSAVPFRGPAAWECLGPSSVRAFPNFRRITSLARRPACVFPTRRNRCRANSSRKFRSPQRPRSAGPRASLVHFRELATWELIVRDPVRSRSNFRRRIPRVHRSSRVSPTRKGDALISPVRVLFVVVAERLTWLVPDGSELLAVALTILSFFESSF